ncbi:hypothetical protein BDW74DRAFT_148060 [Aspergillus multicolor]|uniref:uncharacterized protein n=1 Tax=Aspergillus multicolor TaxID=41759 RepID=UPI003CCCEED5
MPSITASSRTFRILMLHGYAQSSERFRVKARLLADQITSSLLSSILSSYPDGIEFIFPDAPFSFGGETSESSGLESRAWWLNLDDVSRYVGLEETLVRLSESLDGRPIHAAVGFSQGGALAAMVTGLCDASTNTRRRSALSAQGLPVETFLQNLPGQEPLKFVVCISGFRGTMKYYRSFYEGNLSTPSVHMIAKLDTMIADHKSKELVSVFDSPEVIYHGGGHYISRDRALLSRVGDFVQQAYCQETKREYKETPPSQSALTKVKQPPVSSVSKQQFMRRRVTSICTFGARPGFR